MITTNKKLDKLNEQNEVKYKEFFRHLNEMSESGIITHDEYNHFSDTFENRLRSEAVKKALYKVGDRITMPGCYRRVVEITEIRAYSIDKPWQMYIYYYGRKLDRYGNYTKIQPRGFYLCEKDAVPFVPAVPKTKKQ